MKPIPVFIETGEKKTFTGALDYPGWCRSGKDEASALQALLDYAGRYARALDAAGIEFQPPTAQADLLVVERHPGNITTDFGAPAIPLERDGLALEQSEFERQNLILLACWDALLATYIGAQGRELRKGPRGGGRELDEVARHVMDAEAAYLRKLGWNYTPESAAAPEEAIEATRRAVLDAMQAAQGGELAAVGPRGGIRWTLRFYIRRAAWHLLDHVWEIEDRVG